MKRLLHQAGVHLGARLASVGLSFLLFAWIGRVLPVNAAAEAFALMYSLGFALASARMVSQLGAAIQGNARGSQRLRDAYRGLALQRRLFPLLALVVAASSYAHTADIWVSLSAAAIAVMTAPDTDLLRSAAGKLSIFALTFAGGNVLALLLLYFVLPPSLPGVSVALLVQWLPTAIVNLAMAKRLIVPIRGAVAPTFGTLAPVLMLASFDGLILNAPYLGVMRMPSDIAVEASLVLRIFVASLPMLPLLMHWSNSPTFGQACHRLGLTEHTGFMMALIVSGGLAGAIFLGSFIWVSHHDVALSTVFMYLTLLGAYASYAPNMRFASGQIDNKRMMLGLVLLLSLYCVFLAIWATTGYGGGSWSIVLIEAATLAVTAAFLKTSVRAHQKRIVAP